MAELIHIVCGRQPMRALGVAPSGSGEAALSVCLYRSNWRIFK